MELPTNLLSPNKISQFFTYCYRYSGCWYMYSKSSQWRVRVTLTRHPNMVLCHYLEACAWTLQTKYVYVHVWNIWLILNKNDVHNYDKLKIVFYNNKNTVIFQNFFNFLYGKESVHEKEGLSFSSSSLFRAFFDSSSHSTP